MKESKTKVAWLIPSISRGYVWQPIFEEFSKIFPENLVFTGEKPVLMSDNDPGFLNIKILGKSRFLKFGNKESTYQRGIILPPLNLPCHLLKFSPEVIFATGFSIWTMIALFMKLFTGWKIIVVYDGSSPEIDVKDSKIRSFVRRIMTKYTDAFITNTNAGKAYLVESLKAKNDLVFARPYQVADKKHLSANLNISESSAGELKSPVFLYIGLVIKRKGLDYLLRACSELRRMDYNDFTLLVVGDGKHRKELEELTRELSLDKQVKWVGWVDYDRLGSYLNSSDIFVFPTLEDIWGIVVTEAMSFGKPVLCSRLAGAGELIIEGENGHTFNPVSDTPAILAEIMSRFIKNPYLITDMGKKSEQYISSYTPLSIATHLKNVIECVHKKDAKGPNTFSEYSKN
ncbi:MAG: glycosyltransferase family 4 protein [Thermodesulfobacteriota bacterium]